jgi:RHS repeat-associated protein
LSRVAQIKYPDGNLAQEFYGASVAAGGGALSQLCSAGGLGYPVLVVDETGKKSQAWTDALGRTIETDQPGSNGTLSVATCYSYDALANLTSVVQGGQTRSYTYDALSRITQETPAESGTSYASYTSSSGSLCSGDPNAPCSVTDARGITTTNTYDALNRLTSKTYSNHDPSVTYYYDQTSFNCLTITNGKGRRTGMTDGSGMTAWSYDAAGDVLTEQRTIGNVTETTSYTYNLDGSVASITYPSDRTVVYTYSNAERPLSAVDPVNSINYATGAIYSPLGILASVIYGKTPSFQGITQSYGYNSRMELTALNAASPAASALNLSFNYSQSSGNNGNLASITNGLDPTRTQNFTYDPLNRIQSAQTQSATGPNCWGLNFGPDPVGNLLSESVSQCSAPALNVSTDGNNHIIGFGYDAAGNMIADGNYNYTYDGEGLLSAAAGVTYTYDGDDLRVEKSSGTLYWRSIAGDALAESDSNGMMANEYVFFGGGRIARVQANTPPTPDSVFYYFTDELGSTRVVTDSSGNPCYQADYYPYGGEITPAGVSNTCPQNYRFTGYEFDPETGLDYAMARFYDSRIGRFTSVDPLDGSPEDSQSWNAYSYTSNNPINSIDPSGMDSIDPSQQVLLWANSDEVNSFASTYFGGPFDGGVGGGEQGGGAFGPGLAATLELTPNGYSGCLGPCYTLPSMPPTFSPPSSYGSVGAPGFCGGLIPFYGSGRSAINDFQTGHWGWGLVQTGLAISDVFLVKAAATAVGKFAVEGAIKLAARELIGDVGVKEGIYEFTAASGRTYVGQSGDIAARIPQHLASGKLLTGDLSSLRVTEVLGGKTQREIVEQLRIDALGGVKSEGLENIRNPIGQARRHLLVPRP